MSSPSNYQIVLSEEARLDIKGILSYTLQTWGEEQQIKYSSLLDAALQNIRENPGKGRRHAKLPEELRYYHVGRHNVVYRVEGERVEVVRILHDRMDMGRHI